MKKERSFSAREVRALLWLLPVLAVVSWLVWEMAKPARGPAAGAPEIAVAEVRAGVAETETYAGTGTGIAETDTLPAATPSGPFVFDPNTVEYHDLVRLGFSRGEALGIVKYRERGKIFEIPEDFAACYQVSEEMYLRLKPYIRIGEEYRLKPFERAEGNRELESAVRSSEPGQSRQSSVQESDAAGAATGNGNSEVRRMSAQGSPYGGRTQKPLVELNSADSTELISVSGIGAVTVVGIMDYRARLGGFVRVEQLAEVRGVTEQNYERILEQIFIDDSAIQKIDINFAAPKRLAAHPYITAQALRKLLKQRQLKGGWRTVQELENDNIFTPEELERLDPYLLFN